MQYSLTEVPGDGRQIDAGVDRMWAYGSFLQSQRHIEITTVGCPRCPKRELRLSDGKLRFIHNLTTNP